jgi:hypothetical protein
MGLLVNAGEPDFPIGLNRHNVLRPGGERMTFDDPATPA